MGLFTFGRDWASVVRFFASSCTASCNFHIIIHLLNIIDRPPCCCIFFFFQQLHFLRRNARREEEKTAVLLFLSATKREENVLVEEVNTFK